MHKCAGIVLYSITYLSFEIKFWFQSPQCFYLQDLGCSVCILMAVSSWNKSCLVYTVTHSKDLALSLPVLQENGTEEESKLLCQWRKCLEAGSSLPCPRNQLREEVEISWKEFNSCFRGGPRVTEEAERGKPQGKSVTQGFWAKGQESLFALCPCGLGRSGKPGSCGSRLVWPAGRSHSSSSESLMFSARGQTLGHQQPGKEFLFPRKDPDIFIFYMNFCFCFLHCCWGFKVPFEIIVENSYVCSALSKVFCLATLISIFKHADIKGWKFFI